MATVNRCQWPLEKCFEQNYEVLWVCEKHANIFYALEENERAEIQDIFNELNQMH